MKNILVTGGAGFIGSNFVRFMFKKYSNYTVTVLDKLTYAGNLDNLKEVADHPGYRFVRGDICDAALVESVIEERKVDTIVNAAAETHVDRSIVEPGAFIQTDVFGTYVLLEAARKHGALFLLVSTDEVYGSIEQNPSRETDLLAPRSPYSASKGGGEMMVMAYHETYGLPTLITRSSNNIGPFQYPEKVAPLFITNAIDNQSLPIYGDGQAIRDYLYVEDHCLGIDLVLHQGKVGEVYNIGGGNQINTVELASTILMVMDKPLDLMAFVLDRPGHDRRYALDCSKIATLGWRPLHSFDDALEKTIAWYQENAWWWRKIKSGEYADYYRKHYMEREEHIARLRKP